MKLLIVRLSSLGDVVHSLPLAANARAAGATVGWVVERAFAGLLEGNPNCERVFVADTKAWRGSPFAASTWRDVARVRSELAGFGADAALDPQGLWKSAVVARASGAPVIGFAAAVRREPSSAALCRLRVTPSRESFHVVDQNLELLEPLGIAAAHRAPDAGYLLARPSTGAEAFVASLPLPYAVFHPGAGRADKTWSEERFAALARSLSERRGYAPVVSWGPGDAARADRLTALVPGALRAPSLDIPGLARLAASARLFAAGDTGPLHLADALGTPTLALFGPTDPARNGPYRNHKGVIADMRSISDADALRTAESL